jgi:hypothetical protein
MAATALKPRPTRCVTTRVDETLRRISVGITGSAAGPEVSSVLSALFLHRPELTGYDMVYDLRTYSGDVTADDVKPILEAYQAVRVPEADGTRTAFLTQDPNFAFWAEAMTYQFAGREHRVFAEADEAEAFLSRM